MTTEIQYAHITRTPGICGGRPRVDGHRVRVQDIAVEYERQGLTPDEIRRQHPGLSLAHIHSALAYYHDHRAEIDADLDADRAAVQAFHRDHPDAVR